METKTGLIAVAKVLFFPWVLSWKLGEYVHTHFTMWFFHNNMIVPYETGRALTIVAVIWLAAPMLIPVYMFALRKFVAFVRD